MYSETLYSDSEYLQYAKSTPLVTGAKEKEIVHIFRSLICVKDKYK